MDPFGCTTASSTATHYRHTMATKAISLVKTQAAELPMAPIDTPQEPTQAPTPDLTGIALETVDHVPQGNAKAAMKGAEKMAGAIMVARDRIRIAPGFNVRVQTEEYAERVKSIGRSMYAEGWFPSKPLEVFVDSEGYFTPTDGHTRLHGYDHALTLGAQIEGIPVIVTTGRTMADMTVGLVKQNEGRPLQPIEKAIVCHRLAKWGWDPKKIGERLDMTPRYVEELLGLVAAPAALVALVEAGTVSASTAMEEIKEKGAEAAAAAIVEAAKDAPKGAKVTKKTLKKAAAKKAGAPLVPAPVAKKTAAKKDVTKPGDPLVALRQVYEDPAFAKLADFTQCLVLAIVNP